MDVHGAEEPALYYAAGLRDGRRLEADAAGTVRVPFHRQQRDMFPWKSEEFGEK